MNISAELRKELNELSKRVYGVSSRWRTMLHKGIIDRIKETAVGKRGRKIKEARMTHPTIEDVYKIMLDTEKLQNEQKGEKK